MQQVYKYKFNNTPYNAILDNIIRLIIYNIFYISFSGRYTIPPIPTIFKKNRRD
jgi:hypothetical protein